MVSVLILTRYGNGDGEEDPDADDESADEDVGAVAGKVEVPALRHQEHVLELVVLEGGQGQVFHAVVVLFVVFVGIPLDTDLVCLEVLPAADDLQGAGAGQAGADHRLLADKDGAAI